jgi:5,10-methylenetetrahydrofolate reductase
MLAIRRRRCRRAGAIIGAMNAPSSPPGQPESITALQRALAAGRFAVTAEFGPPVDPSPDPIRDAARRFSGLVDAINVTDNQAATVKVSALACASILVDEGVEPILQVTGRDRNLMALQSDLLGAWTLGVRTVLVLSGDPLKVGHYEGAATHVRDLDSLGLTELIAAMNRGVLAAGEPLAHPPNFQIVAAANPLVDQPARLDAKLQAGATLLQTNIVYDIDRFLQWLGPMVDSGITERASMLVGVTPPRSTRMLEHLHRNIPGVEVDDQTFARMAGRQGDAAKAEGIAIAAELIERLRALPDLAGVHLMAPGWETEAVPAILAAAGVTSSSTQ